MGAMRAKNEGSGSDNCVGGWEQKGAMDESHGSGPMVLVDGSDVGNCVGSNGSNCVMPRERAMDGGWERIGSNGNNVGNCVG